MYSWLNLDSTTLKKALKLHTIHKGICGDTTQYKYHGPRLSKTKFTKTLIYSRFGSLSD